MSERPSPISPRFAVTLNGSERPRVNDEAYSKGKWRRLDLGQLFPAIKQPESGSTNQKGAAA